MSKKSYLVLGLEGDFQSYGTDSKFYVRDTDLHPSKSAVIGMMLSSLGWFNADSSVLAQFSSGFMRVDAYGTKRDRIMRDFHTIGHGHDMNNAWDRNFLLRDADGKLSSSPTKTSTRNYLVGMKFKVIIELPADLCQKVVAALKNPIHGPFLGRKNCIPSAPMYRGVCSSLTEAESMDIFPGKECHFYVREGKLDDGNVLLVNDVPLTLGREKNYGSRYITVTRN